MTASRTIWKRRLGRLLIACSAVTVLFLIACHTTPPPLPPHVLRQTQPISLTGKTVAVDFYLPERADGAPVVIVAHGFSRSRRYMAGWGGLLADHGFIVAVLDQPSFTGKVQNARAIADLLDAIRSGRVKLPAKPGPQSALVGFSMGGYSTLLATTRTGVDAWVGLDPVDFDGRCAEVALHAKFPAAILRAEPAAWNRHGNARGILSVLQSPHFALKVRGATHCDVEWPCDLAGQIACGRTDIRRHAVFERYTLAFLQAVLLNDAGAGRVLEQASNDTAVTEVIHALR